MIALLIGYEAVARLFAPVPIHFGEAIPIACLGLAVNVASVWLLSSGGHHHGHGHGHAHGEHAHDDEHRIATPAGALVLTIFEESHPPVFRLRTEVAALPRPEAVSVETIRPDGSRQIFALESRGGFLQSTAKIPEPHAFTAEVRTEGHTYPVVFEEHGEHAHGAAHRDNNMRAAIVHVVADAAVSLLVIVGLLLARAFGWLWMDPLAGIVGALVIASWSYGLLRDTGAILLDMNPDARLAASVRQIVEDGGDRLADLHVWRLGPGHLGAIISVLTTQARDPEFYRAQLARFGSLSHITVEVEHRCA